MIEYEQYIREDEVRFEMIVYTSTKENFLKDVDSDRIAQIVEQKVYQKLNHHTGKAEMRAWNNSLEYMFRVMSDREIPDDAGVAIEYNIPQTSKRVDFMISGYDSEDKLNIVIIELKQWESLKAVSGQDALVETFVGGGNRKVVHPSYQAWSYSMLMQDYNENVQEKHIGLHPCAYLHNYMRSDPDPLDSQQYEVYEKDAPAYTKGQVQELRKFICKCITRGDKEDVLHIVDQGRIRPSKSLQNAVANMMKGNKEFYLIDDQKTVYEEIKALSERSNADRKKRTIIVQGGPGTGKTVIAVNLLSALTQEGQFVQYTSKNSAPRNVYLKKLRGQMRKSSVDNMFKGSGVYTEAPANAVDTILADEAHRLNEKSGMFHNQGENQIKEIIHAAQCSVFFIDESQRVTLYDIGSIDEIEKWAAKEKSEVIHLQLTSQFRCNGSDGYLAWLDHVLEIRETANADLNGIDFDFRVVDDPEDLRSLIVEKNNQERISARILAGYCWEWPKKEQDNPDYHDIKIGNFEMSWNLGNSTTYAIDPDSVNEAGCIHTSQGLEFDYVGVIIGDDLQYEEGHIVTDYTKRAKSDQSLRGIKKLAKEEPEKANAIADEIIKNTYRTLMTRGMKGCYVYCTDAGLAEYLKSMIK